ncbi:MAG TPA: DUF4118 domain-containing protein [Anaerolineaceae bacterium]
MRFFRQILLPNLYHHAGALALVAVMTLLLIQFQKGLGAPVVALMFLLPVVLASSLWGLTPGVLAAFSAFLAFNYFFIPPYRTLMVHQTQDLITLVMFLVVSVFTSQLIGQAREGTRLARRREWEATRMYELILALAGLQDRQKIAEMLAQMAQETFACRQVTVQVNEAGQPPLDVSAPPDAPESAPPTLRQPMRTARGAEGEMQMWCDQTELSREETRLLNTYSSQGALAIERVRLSQRATRTQILEETDKAKSSLLSSVSHELRSPLAVIKASVSSLRSEVVEWDTGARHELLATIEEETDHLNFLVGNLLDMTRIEAGALKPQRKWNALEEIAAGVITRMRKHLEGYQVTLQFPPDLPLVPSDYVLIDQVFSNLISNSIKFAPSGSLISLTAGLEEDAVHVRVTNEGPSVPDEDLERIFDKFNRVRVNDRITGAGLGLSICKGIIEAHEGKIWAENTPCCFVFHFTLPLTFDGIGPQVPVKESDE